MGSIGAAVPVALTGTHKLYATKMTRALNQAKLLEVVHDIRYDSPEQLNVDDWVKYTDPDLGLCYTGKINKKKKKMGSGEGFVYSLSDAGRTLIKEPARYLCLTACPPYSVPTGIQTIPDPVPDGFMLSIPPLGTVKIHYGGTVLPTLPLPVLSPPPPPGPGVIRQPYPPGYTPPGTFNPITYQETPVNVYVKDVILKILESVRNINNFFIDQVSIETAFGNTLMMNSIDKSGMSIADWLNAIVEQTEGGVWETDGQNISFYDFYKKPAKSIFIDNFTLADAKVVGKPILEEADIEESSDNKYSAVGIYGRGSFARWTQTAFQEGSRTSCDPVALTGVPNYIGELAREMGDVGTGTGKVLNPLDPLSDQFFYRTRLYLPHTNCLDFYFKQTVDYAHMTPTATVVLVNGVFYTCHYSYNDQNGAHDQTVYDISTLLQRDVSGHDYTTGVGPNPRSGQYFIQLPTIQMSGFLPGGIGGPVVRPGTPTWDFALLKARYTYYDGPFSVYQKSANPKLNGEGEFVIQRPEFIRYIQPLVEAHDGLTPHEVLEPDVQINDSAALIYLIKAYAKRYLDLDTAGKITLNISSVSGGLISDISLGTEMTDFGIGVRVRAMAVDFIKRTCELDVSTVPIRDFMAAAQDRFIEKQLKYFNWRGKQILRPDTSSIPDVVLDQNCLCVACPVIMAGT